MKKMNFQNKMKELKVFLFSLPFFVFILGCVTSKDLSLTQTSSQGFKGEKILSQEFSQKLNEDRNSLLNHPLKEDEKGKPLPTLRSSYSYGDREYRDYKKLNPLKVEKKLENLKPSLEGDRSLRRIREEKQFSAKTPGSLWVSESQGAYLFSENTLRRIGDPIKVILNGNPKEQLLKKKEILKKILLRKAKKWSYRKAHSSLKGGVDKKDIESSNKRQAEVSDLETKEDSFEPFQLESIPSKIIQKLPRGYYKIKGFETILIGNQQYSVLVMGVVRPQDLVENKVESTKLIDSYFDIIRYKKKTRF